MEFNAQFLRDLQANKLQLEINKVQKALTDYVSLGLNYSSYTYGVILELSDDLCKHFESIGFKVVKKNIYHGETMIEIKFIW